METERVLMEASCLSSFELIADAEQGGFTARLPDILAYGEGKTEDEAIADLKEALRGYIETFGLEDAVSRLASPSISTIDLEFAELIGATS